MSAVGQRRRRRCLRACIVHLHLHASRPPAPASQPPHRPTPTTRGLRTGPGFRLLYDTEYDRHTARARQPLLQPDPYYVQAPVVWVPQATPDTF